MLIEDGEGKSYKFVFGMYAQVVLEETVKESWGSFWSRAKDWNATDILNLFSAGLARHHESMGRLEVADLMDRLGPERCSEIVNEAVTRAMPPKPKTETVPPEQEESGLEGAKGEVRPTTKRARAAQASIL